MEDVECLAGGMGSLWEILLAYTRRYQCIEQSDLKLRQRDYVLQWENITSLESLSK